MDIQVGVLEQGIMGRILLEVEVALTIREREAMQKVDGKACHQLLVGRKQDIVEMVMQELL